MILFKMDLRTWKPTGIVNVASFTDLPLATDDNATGSLIVGSGISTDDIGKALMTEDATKAWAIIAVKPTETEITVTVGEFIEVFDREVFYDPYYETMTTAQMAAKTITDNFADCPDDAYKINITAHAGSSTGYIMPELTTGNLFNAADYIRLIRKNGIHVDIAYTPSLTITFSAAAPSANLPLDDGHSSLVSFEKSKKTVAKVTLYTFDGKTDYYLQADGSIGLTPPSPRIDGVWESIALLGEDEENLPARVAEKFALSSESIQFEFTSDRIFEHGTKLKFAVDGQIHTAEISFIAISSGDDRYRYKAGTAPKTLTDKVRSAAAPLKYTSEGIGALPVAQGGTGAMNTKKARANLGFMKSLATASGNGYAVGDTFDIPGADKYTLFLMRTKTTAGGTRVISIIATKTAGGDTIAGVGGQALDNSNGNMQTAQVRIVKSGTQWNLTHCGYINHVAGGSHSASTTLNISKIIGIV